MKMPRLRQLLPSWKNAILSIVSAILLILAFPDFEYWFLAWVSLVPLMWAVTREKTSPVRSFVLGWLFGTIFFFGTCWWLTFAPITYAGFPPILAYALFFFVAAAAGLFPAIFGAVLSVLLKRFGSIAILAAPFVWVFTEFLRYWLTGNNWNAIGYSQAFVPLLRAPADQGGVFLVSFSVIAIACGLFFILYVRKSGEAVNRYWLIPAILLLTFPIANRFFTVFILLDIEPDLDASERTRVARIIAVQPNVPMSGLTSQKWRELRERHMRLAENALATPYRQRFVNDAPTIVIFPESPMNFIYDEDPEFQAFIRTFAAKNNVSVLFNSAEPDAANKRYFNSAVMTDPQGRKVAQYDKIYLLPFGESVPVPLESLVPAFVGNFSYGKEYDLLPLGDAKAGVMICFESHFGQLSREYVRLGADAIIEMTNDGYLGPTPVLRQHLANAVFRAVETNRPVLRVTNVGITAYINEKGEVLDPATPYQEDTRIWSVSKSDGSQTFYVKYGDWFAWLCSIITAGLLILGFVRDGTNRAETRV